MWRKSFPTVYVFYYYKVIHLVKVNLIEIENKFYERKFRRVFLFECL